jgi:hypothetical protein
MNSTLDLSALIKGFLAVIGIAIAVGQYSNLQHFAREQAAESLAWKRGLPHFFAGRQRHTQLHSKPKAVFGGKETLKATP